MAQVALTVTLCYQFDSEFYGGVELRACVAKAVDEIDRSIFDYKILFDPIELGSHSEMIPENIERTLQRASVVIFEISDLNRNVLYELGLARGQKKKCILLREETATDPLPFDIQPLLYIPYSRHNLGTFDSQLAIRIKQAIEDLPPTDLAPPELLDEHLRQHLMPIRTIAELQGKIREMIDASQHSFYYLGSVGLLAADEQWGSVYEELTTISSCRVVYLRTLRELYDEREPVEYLEDYCLWLVRFYHLVRNKTVELYTSPVSGTWKEGICLFVSDDDTVIITTGAFRAFNNQGVWIKDQAIGRMFQSYAQMLAQNSTLVRPEDFVEYLYLSTNLISIPDVIEEALSKLDFSILKTACSEYVREELRGLGPNTR